MSALDVTKTLYDQLWTLINARTALDSLVKAGNRINDATAQNAGIVDRIKTAPADYPKITIKATAEDEGNKAPRVFGQNSASFSSSTMDYPVPMKNTFIITVTHDTNVLGNQTIVEAEIKGAIASKGPNLGLTWVRTHTIQTRRKETKGPDSTGNTLRGLSEITVIIESNPMYSQLVA